MPKIRVHLACLALLLSRSFTLPLAWVVSMALLLVAASTSAGQVTLAWDAARGSGLAGYRLYYGTSSRTYTTSISVGLQTSYTVTNLTAGQLYYFAVTAYDGTGTETAPSNEV